MMKRHVFGADMVLEPGVVVSFADARQQRAQVTISRGRGDEVKWTSNHPAVCGVH